MSPHDPTVLPEGLPAPTDDGAADHLPGLAMPSGIELPATDGAMVDLSNPALGAPRVVVYAYPRTGRPGEDLLVPDWDLIPGARGCTPQSCAFRDHHAELFAEGATVFGLSTQSTEDQRELVERVHLPFALLCDEGLRLTDALRLPTFEAAGLTLMRRLTLVLRDGAIEHVFYPVFPPDRNAGEVVAWLRANR